MWLKDASKGTAEVVRGGISATSQVFHNPGWSEGASR